MKISKMILGFSVTFLFISACQKQSKTSEAISVEKPNVSNKGTSATTGGMINTGEYKGKKLSLYSGKEVGYMLEMIDHYNNLDARSIRKYSADSIKMHAPDGSILYTTSEDMAGYFATLDSVSWIIDTLIPIQVEGTDIVRILLDTRETAYPKEGEAYKISLLEEFTFQNGKMISVRQWTRELQ